MFQSEFHPVSFNYSNLHKTDLAKPILILRGKKKAQSAKSSKSSKSST